MNQSRNAWLWVCLTVGCTTPVTPPDLLHEAWKLPPQGMMVDGRVVSPEQAWQALPTAQRLIVRLQKPQADDALVVVGGALYHGIPTAFLITEVTDLPWFLREADQSYPQTLFIFVANAPTDPDKQRAFQTAARRQHPTLARQYDTFLGCLMSGLSPEQYDESRRHLLAIDAGLKARGAPKTFCEGIAVEKPAQFGTPKASLVADFDAVRSSEHAVFYAYDPAPRMSSMWVEAGAALAAGVPSLFLTTSRYALPPLLRQPRAQVELCSYGSHEALLAAWDVAKAPGPFTCPSPKSP